MVRMMNREKRPPYAYMIQEALLSEGGRSLSKISISEYILSNYPCSIHDDDHTTLLNQTLQDLTQRKSLCVVINVEDQSGHQYYILENEIYYENTGAERPTTAPHLRPSNYPKVVAQQEAAIRMRRDEEEEKGGGLQQVLKNVLVEEAVKGVVQKVLKNVLEAKIAAIAKAVVAHVAYGIERRRIVEHVMNRIEGMTLEVSESIVEIATAAEAVAAKAAAATAASVAAEEAAEEAAAADYDEDALENTEDHQNDDD